MTCAYREEVESMASHSRPGTSDTHEAGRMMAELLEDTAGPKQVAREERRNQAESFEKDHDHASSLSLDDKRD